MSQLDEFGENLTLPGLAYVPEKVHDDGRQATLELRTPFLEELIRKVRVVVADDHAGFRKALVTTLNLVNGLEVVGEAHDGTSAYESAIALQPDVVLMDLSMPGLSGVEAMVKIHRRNPDIPVIILTAHADPAIEREAVAAGAQGFIAKGGGLQEMVDALLDVQVDHAREELGGS